jgi:hypothetical protein
MKISKYLSKGIGNYCRIEAIMEKVVPSTTFDRLTVALSKLLYVETPDKVNVFSVSSGLGITQPRPSGMVYTGCR